MDVRSRRASSKTSGWWTMGEVRRTARSFSITSLPRLWWDNTSEDHVRTQLQTLCFLNSNVCVGGRLITFFGCCLGCDGSACVEKQHHEPSKNTLTDPRCWLHGEFKNR